MKTLAAILILISLTNASAQMRHSPTKYYTLITDVSPDEAREAALRMDAMAEEYHQRTRDFSGTIQQRMPFYLFRSKDDYLNAGGLPGSAGMFISDGRLLVLGGDHLDDRTWHTVQHEGFHQFAANVIRADLPPWLNEGLAEYFGEALFTGDGFISGVIPTWRMHRIQSEIATGTTAKKFMPLAAFMQLPQDQWNSDLTVTNYDQAWSLVQFLAHADNGRYQQPFSNLMIALSKGRPFDAAWRTAIGSTTGLEDRWQQFWSTLPDDPTRDLYIQATTARLTSFLARAIFQHQQFPDFDSFLSASQSGTLKSSPDQWLPPTLLIQAITDATDLQKTGATLSLVKNHQLTELHFTLDKKTWIGTYQLRGAQTPVITINLPK